MERKGFEEPESAAETAKDQLLSELEAAKGNPKRIIVLIVEFCDRYNYQIFPGSESDCLPEEQNANVDFLYTAEDNRQYGIEITTDTVRCYSSDGLETNTWHFSMIAGLSESMNWIQGGKLRVIMEVLQRNGFRNTSTSDNPNSIRLTRFKDGTATDDTIFLEVQTGEVLQILFKNPNIQKQEELRIITEGVLRQQGFYLTSSIQNTYRILPIYL